MIKDLKKFILVTGHYGSGKTNFAINLAIEKKRTGERVTIVDMDLVNPYFRTSDYKEQLESNGIEVITPVFGHTNLDIPSLPASMYSIFEREGTVIVDVGGDDVGSTVLGRFSSQIQNVDHDMLYVVNRCRNLSANASDTIEIMHEIEAVSRIKCTKLINNTHLMNETDEKVIEDGIIYAGEISEATGLPVAATVIEKNILKGLNAFKDRSDIYPVDIYVKPGWQ